MILSLLRGFAGLLVALTLAALAAGLPAPAVAQMSDPNACKDGGYLNYQDPATGQPFRNQGRCVSFVNQGGTLVPIGGAPVLTISKSGPSLHDFFGEEFPLTYTITVANTGMGTATGVTVTDTLPSAVASASTTPTGSCGGTPITCTVTVGTLAPGSGAMITLTAILTDAACQTTLTNSASVTATGLSPVTSNTVSTFVGCG